MVDEPVNVERVAAAYRRPATPDDTGFIVVVIRTAEELPVRVEGSRARLWIRSAKESWNLSSRRRATRGEGYCYLGVWWDEEQPLDVAPPLMPPAAGSKLTIGYGSSRGTAWTQEVPFATWSPAREGAESQRLRRRLGCPSTL